MEAKMHSTRGKRTATLICGVEPELRAAVEREAERRDTSMSSTIRALIRTALAVQSGSMQAAR
jgi:hypothetical protein